MTNLLTRATSVPNLDRKPRGESRWWHLLLAPVALLFALPFIQMFLTALTPAEEINKFPPSFIPKHLTLTGFEALFQQSDILLWTRNTLIVSSTGVLSQIVLCSLAGYGFARLKFPGRNFGFFAIVATIMIPTQLLMVPTYILFTRLGLIDTLGAAIVPWLASAFGIFLMRQFFLSMPYELEESARLDGAGPFRTFFTIMLPNARPAVMTLLVLQFLANWNDFLWPLYVLFSDQRLTLPVGLARLQGAYTIDYPVIMAGASLAAVPVLILFVFVQRYVIQGVASSGLKG